MSEVKSQLKSAKEAIKQKEYKEALKHCKNVLKIDKDNYNALVFFGVCATELSQYDQAKQAYETAIEHNRGQVLAWQGLCSLLERAKNASWNEDLVKGYKSLLEHHLSDDKKFVNICDKLTALLEKEKKFAEVLYWKKSVISKYSDSDDVIGGWKTIVSTLKLILQDGSENLDVINDNVLQLLEAYKCLFKESEERLVETEKEAENFLQFLTKYSKSNLQNFPALDEMSQISQKFHQKYENNLKIMECLCSVFINQYFITGVLNPMMKKYVEEILGMENEMSFMVSGCIHLSNQLYPNALESFSRVTSAGSNEAVLLYFRSQCLYLMHQNKSALLTLSKCRSATQKVSFSEVEVVLLKRLDMTELHIMLSLEKVDREKFKLLLDKICLNESNADIFLLKLKVLLTLNESLEEVSAILEKIQEEMTTEQKIKFLQIKAEISISEKKYFDAEIRLQEAFGLQEDSFSHFLLGKVYWHLGETEQEYYRNSYVQFLKAAKLDPLYSQTFVFLGLYHKLLIKDLTKAVKCFEKAISLDSSNSEAGQHAGDIYLLLGKEEKAIQIYNTVTANSHCVGESVWAWMRLGLIHLKQNKNEQAIFCFQHALRGEPGVSHYWECLGEAYFRKGSYTSAMKAFTKSLLLDATSTYCRYKIGQIKQMLCLNAEAIAEYKEVLKNNSDYVPALLGVGQCFYDLEKECLKSTFDRRAVDHAQQVLHHLCSAIEKEPRYTCLWKTLGDSLASLYVVDHEKCRLIIPGPLQKFLAVEIEDHANKELVMDVATKCFMMAVKLRGDIACFWHDLAVCTYRHGVVLQGQVGQQKVLQSVQLVKKAIALDSNNHIFWNTLGVITGSVLPSQHCCGHRIDDIQNPGLSQHAFIKALEINSQDALIWANLGVLYLKHDKIKAAHEAFKKAQASDPELVQGWVGQAFIAESIGDGDAMDLFRHSTQLYFHSESSLAYAQWVCRYLQEHKTDSLLLTTRPKPDMSHLPKHINRIVCNASVGLQKSTERWKHDPWSYNTLGILFEHETLYKQAEQAFASARQILTTQTMDDRQINLLRQVLLNQARVLCELKKFDDAIEIYNIASLQTPSEICGLALTYFGAGILKKSQETYEKALSLSTDDHEKSSILAALGMVSYAMQNFDAAKSLLFKSSQLKECNEHGLMALAALGLLYGDGTLATAALVELSKHNLCTTEIFEVKKTKLLASFYLLQGQTKTAQRTLTKAILRYPNSASLWCDLSNFIIQHNSLDNKSILHCMKVGTAIGASQMASKAQAVVSLGFPISSPRDVMRAALRLVHNHPDNVESWVLLSSALLSSRIVDEKSTKNLPVTKYTSKALTKVDEHLNRLKLEKRPNKKELTIYSQLYSWMVKSFVITNIYYGDTATAYSFCDRIIPSLNGDKAQEEFLFLKGLANLQEQRKSCSSSGPENLRLMSTLAAKSSIDWMWAVLAQVYKRTLMPSSAELCHHQLIKCNVQSNTSNFSVLLKLCISDIQAYSISNVSDWLNRAVATMSELMKLSEGDHSVTLLRAVLFYMQGNKKAALKFLHRLTYDTCPQLSTLQEKLLEAWK